jgi:hypothetical protein
LSVDVGADAVVLQAPILTKRQAFHKKRREIKMLHIKKMKKHKK